MPRALCGHIVAEEQLSAKIEHGNAQDVNHSTHAIDVDLFITGDQAFFDALRVLPAAVRNAAPAVLVDRGGPSVVEQLTEIA